MLANAFDSQVLSLPMGEHLTEQDIVSVAETIHGFFKQ
jgi:dTDP-4-amino-4,6-dideoxygalactose transaminase